ncbi:MAG: ABC transporter permease subunit [Anaerolineaceae bacterium]|nr:ABC transporter permease subunit [Anaerolineaceae bacterium]MCB9102019.1 ABC transporter permease subunit [Anaerolineales bacterium]
MLMLGPALAVILFLFIGGLGLALLQSLGYLPFIGRTDLSVEAYRTILSREEFYRSLLLSLWISLASTGLATGLAVGSALVLRQHFRGRRWVMFIFQLNIPIPHLVGAVGILFLFSQSGFLARLAYLAHLIDAPGDFPALVFDRYAIGIILEYLWKSTCFMGVIVLAVMQSVGEDYEQAAQTLGANRWQRLRYVLLPLIMPGILSASILVFAFTFGAFEVPLLLGQRYPSALPVLAYRYYTDVDLNFRPEAMAVSVIISAFVTLLIFVYVRVSRGISRR